MALTVLLDNYVRVWCIWIVFGIRHPNMSMSLR